MANGNPSGNHLQKTGHSYYSDPISNPPVYPPVSQPPFAIPKNPQAEYPTGRGRTSKVPSAPVQTVDSVSYAAAAGHTAVGAKPISKHEQESTTSGTNGTGKTPQDPIKGRQVHFLGPKPPVPDAVLEVMCAQVASRVERRVGDFRSLCIFVQRVPQDCTPQMAYREDFALSAVACHQAWEILVLTMALPYSHSYAYEQLLHLLHNPTSAIVYESDLDPNTRETFAILQEPVNHITETIDLLPSAHQGCAQAQNARSNINRQKAYNPNLPPPHFNPKMSATAQQQYLQEAERKANGLVKFSQQVSGGVETLVQGMAEMNKTLNGPSSL
jgi:hypothetical protein